MKEKVFVLLLIKRRVFLFSGQPVNFLKFSFLNKCMCSLMYKAQTNLFVSATFFTLYFNSSILMYIIYHRVFIVQQWKQFTFRCYLFHARCL